jgi:hypothetical protein
MAQPVFYDPRQSRWKRLRPFFDLLGAAVGLLILFFGYEVMLRSDPLPELLLPVQRKPFRALKENEREKAREKRRQAVKRSHRRSKFAASQRRSMSPGTQPAIRRFESTPRRSTCSIPNGCMC